MDAHLECLLVHTIRIQSYIAHIILRSLLRLCCRSLFIIIYWAWIVLARSEKDCKVYGKVYSAKLD